MFGLKYQSYFLPLALPWPPITVLNTEHLCTDRFLGCQSFAPLCLHFAIDWMNFYVVKSEWWLIWRQTMVGLTHKSVRGIININHMGHSNLLLLLVQICQDEHNVLLQKAPVKPNFPSVSERIQPIRLVNLISCLWDHRKKNFIGGWLPEALPDFYRGLYLCILC